MRHAVRVAIVSQYPKQQGDDGGRFRGRVQGRARATVCGAAIGALALGAWAAGSSAAAAQAGPDVTVRLVVAAHVRAGTTIPVIVEMKVGSGFHVNGHRPTYDYLIPTTVTLTSPQGTLSAVRYPAAIERRFDFADDPLAVYEGTVLLPADLTLPAASGGQADLTAVVAYQACNQQTCFPPAKVRLTATIVVGRSERPRE